MGKFKKTNFKKAVSHNTAQQKDASGFSHLRVPNGVTIYKPEEGKRKFDILPYIVMTDSHPDKDNEVGIAVKGGLWYRMPYKVHRGVGTDNSMVVCPTTFNKPCPICEYHTKRRKEGAEKDELDALRTSKRNLYALMPVNDKKYKEEVHVWDVSDFLFQQLFNKELEDNEDYTVFPDLEEGLTLEVRFEEHKFEGRGFLKPSRIDFKSRDEAYDESILDDVPCLEEMLKIPKYKDLEVLFFQVADIDDEDEDEDDEDEDAPTTKRSSRKKKSAKKPVEVDDEDEDEDDEDEDEEVPVTKVKKRKPTPEPEEDDEDEDDEDDEEDDITIIDMISGAEDIAELKDLVRTRPEFTKQKKDLLAIKKSVLLRKEMMAIVSTPPEKTKQSAPDKIAKSPKTSKSSGKKCPYKHTFGKDCNAFSECDDCEIWDDCIEAQD